MPVVPSLSKLFRFAVVLWLGACSGDVGPSTESRDAGGTPARTETVQRPNVLVVMSDDQAAVHLTDNLLRHAELITLERAGHALMLDDAPGLLRAIEDYLEG